MSADRLHHQPPWTENQPQRQGRYLLGPLLGQGGMGEVREAWDVVLRRAVALKTLRAMDPVSLIRFMHEAQLQARLVHPNICRIYDVESGEGAPHIAMQRVNGQTLAELAHQLSLAEIITIFIQVSQAVQAAHRFKLIHRDLKPSNILLERTPEGVWTPYVCDFGLAMAMDEPAMTYSHGIKGTPAYMAPEQLRGERSLVGPATDVYALGGTLFYAIYEQVPLNPAMEMESLTGKRRGPLPLPRSPKDPIPHDLETVLRKCLEPDPALRYPSMAALAAELKRLGEGKPIQTRPPNQVAQRFPDIYRHRKMAVLSLVSAVVLALGLGWTQQRLRQADERRAEWTRSFALEVSDLENGLRQERMLPPHDMRPFYARLRQRMDSLRIRMATLGPEAEGPALYALGRARQLLGEPVEAQADLEKAWARGRRGADLTNALARVLAEHETRAQVQRQFATGLFSPPDPKFMHRIEALFQQGRSFSTEPDDFSQSILAFQRQDYTRAAASAHTSSLARPWQYEAATAEAMSQIALGRQRAKAGDLHGAETSFRAAQGGAGSLLSVAQSDEKAHHAFLLAGRSLAGLQALNGTLSSKGLDALEQHCRDALRLDPDSVEFQDDHLAISILKATHQAGQGLDPASTLGSALAYLNTRVRFPLTPELLADRMLLHGLLAQRQFDRGQDPWPELAEALRIPGHTPFLGRDFLGDLLNFKARVEAAQGLDPRPTLEATLARHEGILQREPTWSLQETLAETWLIRARWEADHGLEATHSLAKARALAGQALQSHAASAGAYALEGLTWALEGRLAPGKDSLATFMAKERLQASLAHGASPRLQAQLKQELRH